MLALVLVLLSFFIISLPIAKAEENAAVNSNSPYINVHYSLATLSFKKSPPVLRFSFLYPNLFTDKSPFLEDKSNEGYFDEEMRGVPLGDERVKWGNEEAYEETALQEEDEGDVSRYTLSKSKLVFPEFDWQEWVKSMGNSRSTNFIATIPFLNVSKVDDEPNQPGLLSTESMMFFLYINRRF